MLGLNFNWVRPSTTPDLDLEILVSHPPNPKDWHNKRLFLGRIYSPIENIERVYLLNPAYHCYFFTCDKQIGKYHNRIQKKLRRREDCQQDGFVKQNTDTCDLMDLREGRTCEVCDSGSVGLVSLLYFFVFWLH